MENTELLDALNLLEAERNISKEVLLEAIQNALLIASKNHFGKADNIDVTIDPDTCNYHVIAKKTVVDEVEDDLEQISLADAHEIDGSFQVGDVVGIEIESKAFGRIATASAKNVILQKIREEEKELGIALAEQQIGAVRMALKEGLCIITGGPGTGKTMIQKAILDIYQSEHDDNIVCCAPTGRAARRMEESTGHFASTVHSALGLGTGEGSPCGAEEELPADLVIADESSMLDIYVAESLFSALKETCRLVIVGDADQLPSVGPGAVLSELIASGRIPVVRLDHVFRQEEGSLIAENAKRIRHGMTDLAFGEDFRFIPSGDTAESAGIIEKLYLQETAAI